MQGNAFIDASWRGQHLLGSQTHCGGRKHYGEQACQVLNGRGQQRSPRLNIIPDQRIEEFSKSYITVHGKTWELPGNSSNMVT